MIFGDPRGGHIRAFNFTDYWVAYYYGGAGFGISLGVYGRGYTANEAVRDLWKGLHK